MMYSEATHVPMRAWLCAIHRSQYKDAKKHGLGKYTFADGTVDHDGEWENGEPKE